MMMKAIEYEINKMEKNSKKIENEIKDGGERVKEIDKNMDVINNDLKKLIYERETEALMKRIDYTLEYLIFLMSKINKFYFYKRNPLKTSEVFGNKSEASFEQNKKKFDSKLATIFQNNEEAFQEIDKCMQKFGLNLPPNDYSFSLNQQSSENSNQIVQITEEMSNSITESITNKMLQKAKTLERELRGQKNKKLVCALENAPTQRNNKNNKSTENKKINVTKEAPKNTSKNLNKKPKQEIKKRPINSHY